jgi:hypothetical protein
LPALPLLQFWGRIWSGFNRFYQQWQGKSGVVERRKNPARRPGLFVVTRRLPVVMTVMVTVMTGLCGRYDAREYSQCDDSEKNAAKLHGEPPSGLIRV